MSFTKEQELPFSSEGQSRKGISQFQLGLGGAAELLSLSQAILCTFTHLPQLSSFRLLPNSNNDLNSTFQTLITSQAIPFLIPTTHSQPLPTSAEGILKIVCVAGSEEKGSLL